MFKFEDIIKKDDTAYFISPHLDDAILSAGGLIHYLVRNGIEVRVITIFTRPSPPPETRHARKYVRLCGWDSASELFKQRLREDILVFGDLGIKPIHLDFIDAAWRKKQNNGYGWMTRLLPEVVHLYPLRLCKYLKIIHRQDRVLMKRLEDKLSRLVPGSHSVVFCPLARGNHVDHIITKQVCEKIFKKVVFWDDFPYSLKETGPVAGYVRIAWNKYLNEKISSVESYKTQLHLLFGKTRPPVCPETYYLLSD